MSASIRRISEKQIKPLILSYQHMCFTSGSLKWECICAAARHFLLLAFTLRPFCFYFTLTSSGLSAPNWWPCFQKRSLPTTLLSAIIPCRQSLEVWGFEGFRKQDQVCFHRRIKIELWLINISKISRPIGFWGTSNCSSSYLLWILQYCNWRENIC